MLVFHQNLVRIKLYCSLFVSLNSQSPGQSTSFITLVGQITVFQRTQALCYTFFMKSIQDNSPFPWLGQLLYTAGKTLKIEIDVVVEGMHVDMG